MKTFNWNCWGLGNSRTVRNLNRLVRDKKPSIVFLLEMKILKDGVDQVKRRIGFSNCLSINPTGRSGGLAIMWSDDITLDVVNYSSFHIHTYISDLVLGEDCFLAGFYSQPIVASRRESWNLLSRIGEDISKPQCVLGDFNEITSQDEKLGVCLRPYGQIEAFQLALETSSLYDLSWSNQKFTWSKKHHGETLTKERLDLAVSNKLWFEQFGNCGVEVLTTGSSDTFLFYLPSGTEKASSYVGEEFLDLNPNGHQRKMGNEPLGKLGNTMRLGLIFGPKSNQNTTIVVEYC